jgi:hypothetical protein
MVGWFTATVILLIELFVVGSKGVEESTFWNNVNIAVYLHVKADC